MSQDQLLDVLSAGLKDVHELAIDIGQVCELDALLPWLSTTTNMIIVSE